MSVETIKREFMDLSVSERSETAPWIESFQEEEFDRKIERDFSPGGRGEAFLAELRREIAEGKAKPMEEACLERKSRGS